MVTPDLRTLFYKNLVAYTEIKLNCIYRKTNQLNRLGPAGKEMVPQMHKPLVILLDSQMQTISPFSDFSNFLSLVLEFLRKMIGRQSSPSSLEQGPAGYRSCGEV